MNSSLRGGGMLFWAVISVADRGFAMLTMYGDKRLVTLTT